MAFQIHTESGATENGHTESSAPGSPVEDDRSSSLSEIEDELDKVESNDQQVHTALAQETEPDSEAETERLEQSPHTPAKTKKPLGAGPFEKSPSKLAQAMSAEDDKTAGEEQYSDSEMSSPLASLEEPLDEEIEEQESDSEQSEPEAETSALVSGKKRKRGESEESADHSDTAQRPVRRRTGSVRDDNPSAPPTDEESTGEEPEAMDVSRESTAEPVPSLERDEVVGDAEEEEPGEEDLTAKGETEKTRSSRSGRTSQPLNADDEEDVAEAGEEDEGDVVEDAENVSEDENDENVDEEIDEAEAEKKNEEEFAKKMVAMDSLAELERQFAILRDKLYDERIGAINRELMQLNGPSPSNAEYREKLRYILQHRDEKQEYEHKLLAYKVQALKTKSVAERAQIHSAYYQTIRDIREHHLDQVNEMFYKIQRDRFKPDESMIEYTIPFPERRSQQISQQASYNREVSILAGVAKYVGFPAAPEISAAKSHDIEDDLEKMGVPVQTIPIPTALGNEAFLSKTATTAEEQFLEETPWANPKHPVHSRMNRQPSDQHVASSLFATPANQKTFIDSSAANGSASTIPENLSAQASSALNTPYDHETNNQFSDRAPSRFEAGVAGNGRSGEGFSRKTSLSPTETRKVGSLAQGRSEKTRPVEDGVGSAAVSAQSRASLYSSPLRPDSVPRPQSTQNEPSGRQGDSSPLASLHTQPGITAGSGYNRIGAR